MTSAFRISWDGQMNVKCVNGIRHALQHPSNALFFQQEKFRRKPWHGYGRTNLLFFLGAYDCPVCILTIIVHQIGYLFCLCGKQTTQVEIIFHFICLPVDSDIKLRNVYLRRAEALLYCNKYLMLISNQLTAHKFYFDQIHFFRNIKNFGRNHHS